MKVVRLVALSAILSMSFGAVHGQSYPDGPITVIVPFPPGGTTDTVARVFAAEVSNVLGQSLLVENRPGATGSIGTAAALSAPADGYTLLVANSDPLAANAINFPNLPYDPRTDLAPISLLYRSMHAIVASNSIDINSFDELLEYAAENPDELSYGSSGIGSNLHFTGELINLEGGIDMMHIPYQGGAAAVTDVIAGQLPLVVASLPAVASFYAEGQLKILAVTGVERHPEYPEIPTVGEFLPGLATGGWGAFVAPAGTPSEVIDILNDAAIRALASPEVEQTFRSSGVLLESSGSSVVLDVIVDEISRREALIAAGVSLE